jgi:hypothetical protein
MYTCPIRNASSTDPIHTTMVLSKNTPERKNPFLCTNISAYSVKKVSLYSDTNPKTKMVDEIKDKIVSTVFI